MPLPPKIFQNLCTIPKAEDIEQPLVCKNVAIGERLPPGEYSFTLNVIPNVENSQEEIVATTDFIKVEAKPIEIRSFKLNGQELRNQKEPKNQNTLKMLPGYRNIPQILEFSWDIEAGKQATVEFLPIGGVYETTDSLKYALPPGISQQIFMLKVTDPFGKIVTHTVIIQVYESNNPSRSKETNENDAPSQTVDPVLPQPLERPPQLN